MSPVRKAETGFTPLLSRVPDKTAFHSLQFVVCTPEPLDIKWPLCSTDKWPFVPFAVRSDSTDAGFIGYRRFVTGIKGTPVN
jgi:hypothetical protein